MSNGKQINSKELKARASHRWLDIFQELAPTLIEAAQRAGKHVPCPVHGGSNGFRFYKTGVALHKDGMGICNSCQAFKKSKGLDGLGILCWVNGWHGEAGYRRALEAVDNYLSGNSRALDTINQPIEKQNTPKTNKNKSGKAKAVYAQLKSSTLVPDQTHVTYLASRGIQGAANINSESILFSNGIVYKDELRTPAIIGKITNAKNELLGLQRIYLTPDGKKLNQLPNGESFQCKQFIKKADTLTGGAIRFGEAGRVLAVGEGLETMLAVALAFKSRSVAAACTASLLAKMEIPEHVEKLLIYADKDRSGEGERAANELFERERYIRAVEVRLPPLEIPENSKGIDWLDVYTMDLSLINKYHLSGT